MHGYCSLAMDFTGRNVLTSLFLGHNKQDRLKTRVCLFLYSCSIYRSSWHFLSVKRHRTNITTENSVYWLSNGTNNVYNHKLRSQKRYYIWCYWGIRRFWRGKRAVRYIMNIVNERWNNESNLLLQCDLIYKTVALRKIDERIPHILNIRFP